MPKAGAIAQVKRLLLAEDHTPRWQYDCQNCKFAWCCGPLCACWSDFGPAPKWRRTEVHKWQAKWRRLCKLRGTLTLKEYDRKMDQLKLQVERFDSSFKYVYEKEKLE